MVNNSIEEINGVWCVSGDTGTNPHILEKGLKWDNTFQKVLDIVGPAKGRIAIDVGAFIGDSTKWFVDAGFDTFAFEPYPDAFECLCKNLSNVQAFQWAIGFDESIGLLTEYGGNLGGRGLIKGETATQSLDDIFPTEKCGLLKIDTEGFEPFVLKGAQNLLKRTDFVMVEVNKKALQDNGFSEESILQFFSLVYWEKHIVFEYYDLHYDVLFERKKVVVTGVN